MTVANNYAPARYVGNGSTRSFAVSWRLENDDDFVVYQKVGGVQSVVDPSNYTAVNTDNEHGVVFNTAPANGTIIVITRATPHEQDTPYKTSSGFQAIKVEEDFDSLTMMVQELQIGVDRAVKVPETSTETQQQFSDSLFTARDEAVASAQAALVSEGNAAMSATDAHNSEQSAEAFARQAQTAATTATNKADAASGSATTASQKAELANSYMIGAYQSKELAKQWAISTELVDDTDYSAKHYALAAADSYTEADRAADAAAADKQLADDYAQLAQTRAGEAADSANYAMQWAVKMDGKVADEDYSAKYYADLASQSVGTTGANKDLSNLTATGEAKFTAKQDVIDSSHKLSASLVSGLAAVATSGAYSDLSGKPDLSNYIQDGSAFTYYITEQRTNPVIDLINTAVATGTPLNYDNTWWLHFKDKNERTMGGVNYRYTATYGSSIAYLWAYKSNASTDTEYATIGVHYPATDAPFVDVSAILRPDRLNDNTLNLGTASYRWKQLFAGTTTISTSDEREKQDIEAIPDAVLDAWGDVEFYRFKYKDAVAEKGSAARWHTGMIAQRIESVFASHGLNARDYGLLCYDEWAADEEEGTSAGNRYALRYEECLTMEAAYQRRRADRIEARLAALEARA